MSKYKIINLFDKIFVTVAVFLVIYAWINFFVRNLFVTFILSLIFCSAIVFLIFYLFNKKQTKNANAKKYINDIEEKFLAFRLSSKTQQLSLLNSILQKNYQSRILNNSIVYKKEGKTHMIIVASNIEKINEFEFINLLQGKKNIDIIEIVCNDFNSTLNLRILNGTDVIFITKKMLYDEFFFKHSIYPDCSVLNSKIHKRKFKEILKSFFVPEKAKSYFLCGLILIFSSIILPYHAYYLIFGSALLIFSIISKLRPIFKR